MDLWMPHRADKVNGLQANGYIAFVAINLRKSKLFLSIISRRFGSKYKAVQFTHCCAQNANPGEHVQLPGTVSGPVLGSLPAYALRIAC